MNRRPSIPRQLKREILTEAGYRCAIPTCKHPTTEIAHIIPWSEVETHEFQNLIALCPNCHTRYDKKEIDRKAIVHYKMNLSLINSRYGDLEQRVLRGFSQSDVGDKQYLPKQLEILVDYLVEDGLIEKDEFKSALGEWHIYLLTEKGKEFIDKWINAELLT
jgi:hypothetical protein